VRLAAANGSPKGSVGSGEPISWAAVPRSIIFADQEDELSKLMNLLKKFFIKFSFSFSLKDTLNEKVSLLFLSSILEIFCYCKLNIFKISLYINLSFSKRK
jgi:hypothetical protein